jgi:hypothetical protein
MSAAPPIIEPAPEIRARIVAEARERVRLEGVARAKDDLFMALHPAPRHGRAALECLEIDDDVGLAHHLDKFFASAKSAWAAREKLRRLESAPGKGGAPHE